YSHTSDQHPWFRESRADRTNPKADWYVWADPKADGSPPSNWQSVFGGPAWAWDARRGQYYLHNFLTEQPDLNVHDVAVQDALLEVPRFWLERGVDGFRVADAAARARGDRSVARGRQHRMAELGVLESRCTARGLALGRARGPQGLRTRRAAAAPHPAGQHLSLPGRGARPAAGAAGPCR